jgi:4'-phosphopantetheinyl transferase
MPWTAAADFPPAWGETDVHLWWCATPPDAAAPRLRRARLDALLRHVLSPYVGLAPEALRFAREPQGRPFLLGDAVPDFNLSDTVGGTVVAVASQPRIGVDLERLDRRLSHRRLAQRYFSRVEADALDALPEDAARVAFLRLWTAKEASCKSTGTGIYGQLDRWVFDPASESPRLGALPAEAGDAARWHHLRVAPAPGYTAVLACDGWVPRVRHFELHEA